MQESKLDNIIFLQNESREDSRKLKEKIQHLEINVNSVNNINESMSIADLDDISAQLEQLENKINDISERLLAKGI